MALFEKKKVEEMGELSDFGLMLPQKKAGEKGDKGMDRQRFRKLGKKGKKKKKRTTMIAHLVTSLPLFLDSALIDERESRGGREGGRKKKKKRRGGKGKIDLRTCQFRFRNAYLPVSSMGEAYGEGGEKLARGKKREVDLPFIAFSIPHRRRCPRQETFKRGKKGRASDEGLTLAPTLQ